MQKTEVERVALEEYHALVGKRIRPPWVCGYRDGCATSDELFCDERVVVRVVETPPTDILNWQEGWLDPALNVEIIERGNLPDNLQRCWCWGTSHGPDGQAYSPGIEVIRE